MVDRIKKFAERLFDLIDEGMWGETGRGREECECLAALRLQVLQMLSDDPLFGELSRKLAERIRDGHAFNNASVAFLFGYAVGREFVHEQMAPEYHRLEGKLKDLEETTALSKKKANLAHDLFAEYHPSDLKRKNNKGGKEAAYTEIGQVIQQRLDLPEPVPPETVRDYLKPKKTGEG
jgi:hypothetical protein